MYRVVLSLVLLSTACAPHGAKEHEEPRSVKSVVVAPLTHLNRDFAALSTADDAVTLAFKLSGRVLDVPVAKGQMVRGGELLARLDSRDVELQVSSAKAAYNEAQSRLERARRLLAHDAISLQEVESLESSTTQALTLYENSLDMLSDTRIVAPYDGVVERTYVDNYQRVQSGEPIVRIVKPTSSTVSFTAPENIVKQLSNPATRYSVKFEAYPDVVFSAAMKSFARTSSDALGFPVSLRLVDVDTTKYKISPGMTCIAQVTLPDDSKDAVVVPLTAIYAPQWGGCYVWRINSDDRVQLYGVKLGAAVGRDSVAVVDGLEAGDRVVAAGVYQLREDEKVRIIK